jgi:hypothetical protein
VSAKIARSSYNWLAPQEAEREYAVQKQKLAMMRRDGSYPERERN